MPLLPCDHDVLYSLLAAVTDSENAKAIAESLLGTYGSIERIFSCHISELKREIPGSEDFKNKIAFYLETAKAIARRRKTEGIEVGEIYNEVNVARYLLGLFLFQPMEMVYMLFYDKKMRYIGTELVSSGTVNTSHITVRRTLEISLRHNAKYIVIAHNHPLGKATPSPDDVSTTNNLVQAFADTGLKLLDHFVIGGASYTQICRLTSGKLRQDSSIY